MARLKPPSELRTLVFSRAPVPGHSKTRLIPLLGPERAAQLHQRMLCRTLETAAQADCGPIELWCTPDCFHRYFQLLAKNFDIQLEVQVDGNLGQRMAHAAARGLERSDAVVLVGTDCPGLLADDFLETARRLTAGPAPPEGHDDAVLGPAADGGYFLLGLRRLHPSLFEDVDWGSERVLGQTRQRLRALAWRWHELSTRVDVDTPEDLKAYPWLSAD